MKDVIIIHMNSIEKFLSDIEKIKKHDRADNGGHYDGKRACTKIASLFESNNRHVQSLSRQIADYWLNTFVLQSDSPADEPSEENIGRIRAFQAFLDSDDSEDFSALGADDWETLRDFVDGEAETIDLDMLQNLMSLILAHGAL